MQNHEPIPVSTLAAALARVSPDAPVMVEYHGSALAVTACMPGGAWGLVLHAEEPLDEDAEGELAQGARL